MRFSTTPWQPCTHARTCILWCCLRPHPLSSPHQACFQRGLPLFLCLIWAVQVILPVSCLSFSARPPCMSTEIPLSKVLEPVVRLHCQPVVVVFGLFSCSHHRRCSTMAKPIRRLTAAQQVTCRLTHAPPHGPVCWACTQKRHECKMVSLAWHKSCLKGCRNVQLPLPTHTPTHV